MLIGFRIERSNFRGLPTTSNSDYVSDRTAYVELRVLRPDRRINLCSR